MVDLRFTDLPELWHHFPSHQARLTATAMRMGRLRWFFDMRQGSVSFPLLRLADGVRFDRLLPTAQGGAVAVANAQIKRDRYLTQQVSRDEQAVIA